jgi:hypothetical protein
MPGSSQPRKWPTFADIVQQNHAVLRACSVLSDIDNPHVLEAIAPLRTEMTKLSLMIEVVDRGLTEATPCDA